MPALANGKASLRRAQRTLRRQVRHALRALDGRPPDDEQVHAIRRQLKKARATLRLLKGSVRDARYRAAEARLRDAARPLGRLRDARIIVQTLPQVRPRANGALQRRLRRDLERQRCEVSAGPDGLAVSRRQLRKARREIDGWPRGTRAAKPLDKALGRRYRAGRCALQQALRAPSTQTLHQLRKQSKYLYLQLRLFAPSRRSRLGRLEEDFHRLSDQLGDDHDLALLREQAGVHRDDFPRPEAQTQLLAAIDRRRSALQEQALLRAEHLYRSSGRRFARRVRGARKS